MNAPDRLPSDAAGIAETEARLRAGLRRAPLPESAALRLASAQPGGQSRRGLWFSRIVSAATVALCAGLVWHFTANPARMMPGGENEKTPPKDEQDENDNGRTVQRYDLKYLLAQARSNKDVMRSLFPERGEPALGLEQPKPADPTDDEIRERVAKIVKDMLGARAEFSLDTAKGLLTAKAAPGVQDEVAHLLKLLRGDFDGEDRIVAVEFRTYELDEKQFAKLLPDAKADASTGLRALTAKELEALLQMFGKWKVNAQRAPRMSVFPGQGATISVTDQKNYVADYEIKGTAYDPVIKTFMTGFRFTVRAWPSAGERKIAIQFHEEFARHVSTKVRLLNTFTVLEKAENPVVSPLSLSIEFPVVIKQALDAPTVVAEDGAGAVFFARPEGKEVKADRVLLTLLSAKVAELETDLFSDEPVIKDGTEKTYDVPDFDKMKFIDVPNRR